MSHFFLFTFLFLPFYPTPCVLSSVAAHCSDIWPKQTCRTEVCARIWRKKRSGATSVGLQTPCLATSSAALFHSWPLLVDSPGMLIRAPIKNSGTQACKWGWVGWKKKQKKNSSSRQAVVTLAAQSGASAWKFCIPSRSRSTPGPRVINPQRIVS